MLFHWRTDFDFPWADGWQANQDGRTYERDIVAVIPGRDRKRAVILADHYDTAYMADCYEKQYGGDGARVAAAGADDNHSATACLMLAAPILLDLSRQGKLGCDVWLVHLTGEEFPSDCLGARALTQRLVEGTLKLRLPGGKERDMSRVEIRGVYVMDMIAHNNDRDKDIFQMSPGAGAPSQWLAQQAQAAAAVWNASVPAWNQRPLRRGRGRGKRSLTSGDIPEVAAHPTLLGEVRTPADPHSTLYNTDGQVFSDAGVPVVLFMENYDINRQGYHDTHDTMDNIDLDYGAAVAAIAIESAVRAATEKPPR
jgi:Zn-dependent M28 family amino/carboxypeptidase